eukprot:scaffold302570_cov26-Tisochrysis_lutea.AAC.2
MADTRIFLMPTVKGSNVQCPKCQCPRDAAYAYVLCLCCIDALHPQYQVAFRQSKEDQFPVL